MPIAGRKEGEDVLQEMLLLLIEFCKAERVFREIDLLRGPERSDCLLVHCPEVVVDDGEGGEPTGGGKGFHNILGSENAQILGRQPVGPV